MKSFEFTVAGENYSGLTASAIEQQKLLRIVIQSGVAGLISGELTDEKTGETHEISDLDKVFYITIMQDGFFEKAVDIVTGKSGNKGDLIKTAAGVPVTAEMFDDNIHRWLLIIAEAIRGNLAGFTELTAAENLAGASENQ